MSVLQERLEQVLTRVPADVKALLIAEGESENRSANQQVAHILTIWYRRGGKETWEKVQRRKGK